MRWLWIALALTGCSSVAGLDEYCLLEDDAPPGAVCRAAPDSCGCPSGETCRAITGDSGDVRGCGPLGDLPTNERCDSIAECGAAMTCWGWSAPDVFHCRSYCEDDDDCVSRQGAGSFCQSHRDTFSVCSKPCTPGSDDRDCGPGLACDVTRGVGFCRLGGSAAFDAPCDGENLCQRGLSCQFASDQDRNVCFRICGPAMPPCSEGAACLVVEEDGSVRPAGSGELGICGVLAS